ncbi:PilN domain-containing protein [Crenobacter sp. SG2303]|uniref:PilN domain-containing protein n=1 Tax=Crenobacter oryzisoli TaxID=3056844 RepID=A0ABT7XML4_9NEIS|nr:PilN domain-containing protein [Crenobacter sp. SG2303]MDN0074814.1 PilN domain-containing protein [Crenobacter sp. SG2303]
MILINLLPHREARQHAHRRRFRWLCATSTGIAVLLVGATAMWLSLAITVQERRNAYLQQAITKLDQDIGRIDLLKRQRSELLARKTRLDSLLRRRSDAIRLMDQLARLTPDGVYLRELKQDGEHIALSGYAISGARVPGFLRALGESDAFDMPQLVEVKTVTVNELRVSEFAVAIVLKQTGKPPATPSGDPR